MIWADWLQLRDGVMGRSERMSTATWARDRGLGQGQGQGRGKQWLLTDVGMWVGRKRLRSEATLRAAGQGEPRVLMG